MSTSVARSSGLPPRRAERGYAFLIVLVALAIVAWLARDSLSALFASVVRGPDLESRLPPAARVVPDPAAPAAAPQAPVERARAVEDTVRQASEARMRRGEEAQR